MKKIYIATSRQVGHDCIAWAQKNMPPNCRLVDSIGESDIVISVLYEKLLSPDEIKGRKCYNFHPGSLPDYRGAGCYSWAIINEEESFGITLHVIDEGIDTGDIISHCYFPIEKEDTAYSLFQKGEKVIYKMFKEWFSLLLTQPFATVQQDTSSSSLYLRKDLQRAKDLTKFIKAFYFPNKESAYYYNKEGKKIYINY
ncbi:MAG TPA: hypothetical protein DCM10_08685 [Xanthomarina gelatinilytica]|nr:hypothetical protein [Xanthomarina gelatinilytica]|tara:strand:+ start:4295 stop:4888 length:594 start_codon:yes stop_codon:yes gene_type:complete